MPTNVSAICSVQLWQRCLFKYLKCEPENHYVMLTEPPMNPPENRELAAEIMFETFGVPGLYMAVQAVLSLTAAWTTLQYSKKELSPLDLKKKLTGCVIDSGDGVTHVVPVAEGYVIGTSIRYGGTWMVERGFERVTMIISMGHRYGLNT